MAVAVVAASAAITLGAALATTDTSPDAQLVHWISSAGALGILAFVLVALMRGWLVTGRTHERVLTERNRLLELALTSTRAAERAVTIAHEDRDIIRRIAGTADTDP